MSGIEYSSDATNVLDLFYRCDAVVYVEGDDDVPFWSIAFKVFADANVEVQSVGGAVELDKIIDRIVDEDLKLIAARDSDFIRLTGADKKEERVLYTYGYSIENTLYCHRSLSQISSVWCRQYRADAQVCREWLEGFFERFKVLIAYDVACHVFEKTFSALGDNCTRFMDGEKSIFIDAKKLESKISEMEGKMNQQELAYAQSLIDGHGVNYSFHMKGHFLASAAQKYLSAKLKDHGRGNSISFESMYSSAIEFVRGNFKKLPGADYYSSQIKSAMQKLDAL
ncbi:DUF4435 domain-containing protein [Pseudomonas sp. 2(2015)]|uniref:DUF4435 domain-containing protein n=1 Tax=Pseudomonas sp. 2(2015) TaxID=1619950 RepID=UPI0009E48278|nr:DUF4435 domain-containing protein [Pseudomonas sp. 2(2015)]